VRVQVPPEVLKAQEFIFLGFFYFNNNLFLGDWTGFPLYLLFANRSQKDVTTILVAIWYLTKK
ncbi:hypothetical protein, partial [Chishuiella sp.]|uniref:hypothetical protein n=1 Tax=Chishuiella sp. TaxID=1969467 RepID=UPI0028A992FF